MSSIVEIERKYIIEMPKTEELPECEETPILQIYLKAPEGVTHRIRKRCYKEGAKYFETVKKRIDKISAYEDEREISESEFLEKSKEIKEGTKPLSKKRISFSYEGRVIEIDVYPEWKRCAIMEIELPARECEVKIPSYIKIIREVTGIKEYSNASMSEHFPDEDK